MQPHHRHESTLFTIGVLLAVLLNWSGLLAEGTSQPGPNAANFKMQNNGSGMDSYTGSFNWKQRLVTVPGRGGLDFPIDLTYHSGIGTGQEASWVGLGFGLNLGSIERSVVIYPDDMLLYAKFSKQWPEKFDGWLFDDNVKLMSAADSAIFDGPDMWTVALNEIGANISIVADSSNIFVSGSNKIGPAGEDYFAYHNVNDENNWKSKFQRRRGLALRIGDNNYPTDNATESGLFAVESQRQCYVSPPMGTTEYNVTYNYEGEIQLVFNDSVGGFNDNAGQCKVLVYKLPRDSTRWQVSQQPITVNGGIDSWTSTGVSVAVGDRFALFVQTRKFEFEKWNGWRVSYDVEFSDWNGYYLNPECYSNPYGVVHQGYTPRIKSFALTSPQGVTYRFDKFDFIKATSRKNQRYLNGSNEIVEITYDSVSVAFANSFKLTSVLSSDYVDADDNGIPSAGDYGSWVRIVYGETPTKTDYTNKSLKMYRALFNRLGTQFSCDSVWQWHYTYYPQYVETPTHKLEFVLSSRRDNLGEFGPTTPDNERPKKLDSLKLYVKQPTGDSLIRTVSLSYADVTHQPATLPAWQDDDPLGWHHYYYGACDDTTSESLGKLTLLDVIEVGATQETLPSLKFKYDTNPSYVEPQAYGEWDNNVDVDINESGGEYHSFYAFNYQESWGYYRPDMTIIPGDHQRAWSLKEIVYPSGAKEILDWESNQYVWEPWPPTAPPGADQVRYKPDGVTAFRGGIRLKSHRLSGGMGNDSAYVYQYGEGVMTKPQSPVTAAFYCGFIGNSQEVGYRSSEGQLDNGFPNQKTVTYFTNGSAQSPGGGYGCLVDYDGRWPVPAVDSLGIESYRDRTDTCGGGDTHHVLLDGVKRGLPYLQVTLNANGDTLQKETTAYEFDVKASHNVDVAYDTSSYNWMPDMKARSLWVKATQSLKWTYDENGEHPIFHRTLYAYDPINGLIARQVDSLGNGEARRDTTEYLHTQISSLTDTLARRNLLNLVYRQWTQRDYNSTIQTLAKTEYDYKDFGNGRVYPWKKKEYRTISPDYILTTTYDSYDKYGNPTSVINPANTKTTMRWGYSGTRKILEAPNADTGEVTYNGFEDSVKFDGWQHQNEVLSSEDKYSGIYSAKVSGSGLFGPNRFIDDNKLANNEHYVFSGWVHTTGTARFSVDFQNGGAAPDTSVTVNGGGWQRLEIVFKYPVSATKLECYTVCDAGTAYFDDLRIHPADCPMQTFAYDHATGQLQAAFDANNVAGQRLYYDGLGRLKQVRNPEGELVTSHSYHYSRTSNPNQEFNPDDPNYVYTLSHPATQEACPHKSFYDGLGREIQSQDVTDWGSGLTIATVGSFYGPSGQLAASLKPVEVSTSGSFPYVTNLVPGDWQPGDPLASEAVADYYDASGPGPDCQGYPYTQYVYSNDPLHRVKEVGYPGITWKVGNNKTTLYSYWSNAANDSTGWSANQLFKTKTVDEGGLATYQYTDKFGRVRQIQVDSTDTGPSFKTTFDYDVAGNLKKSTRYRSANDSDITTYDYNALGQLIYQKSADAGGVYYLYDKNGNLRFVKDSLNASSQFVYYKYDKLGRKIEEGTKRVPSVYFTQANADVATYPTTGNSPRFIFRYDSLGLAYSRGRLSSWSDDSFPNSRKLKYDNLGRVIQEEVRVDDSVTVLNYTYDWLGNLKTFGIGTSPVFPTVYYTYNMGNILTAVGTETNETKYANMTYWPDGMIRANILRNPSDGSVSQQIDYKYNPRGWLLGINDVGAKSTDKFFEALGYNSSNNGDIDWINSEHYGQTGSTETFAYDRLHRLSGWVINYNSVDVINDAMAYDRAGNFTSWQRITSPPLTTQAYTYTYYSGTNKLKKIGGAVDNVYDLNGNLASEPGRTFEQEYRNIASAILSPGGAADDTLSFVYDADLRRVKKAFVHGWDCNTKRQKGYRGSAGQDDSAEGSAQKAERSFGTGGDPIPLDTLIETEPDPNPNQLCWDRTTTKYIYTYDGRVVREYWNGPVRNDYLYAGAQRIGVSSRTGSTYKLCYYLNDHLGSTRALVDSTGFVVAKYDYYPYGGLRASTVNTDTKVRFTGKYYDGENVSEYYFGARYLNGLTNRFNSVDPAAGKYPGWSPYAYCLNNPMRLVDPSGESAQELIGGIGTGVWEAIAANAASIANMVSGAGNPAAAAQSNVAMGAGIAGLLQDPVGVASAAWSQISSTWSSGDQGKGQIIGRVVGEIGIAIALSKGTGALGKMGEASAAATDVAKAVGKGTNVVYEGTDAAGAARYVGHTGQVPAKRFYQNLRDIGSGKEFLKYDVVEGAEGLSKTEARRWEQALIDKYGLGKNGGQLLNKINAVAK